MGAIKREMNNARWTLASIGYMCLFAWCCSLMVYQIGGLFTGEAAFNFWTVVAFILAGILLWLLFRKGYDAKDGALHTAIALEGAKS